MPEPSDRRSVASRARDQELDRWRGQISEQVDGHGRKFREINGDLRDLRKSNDRLREEVVNLSGQVREARNDIGETVVSLSRTRDQEMLDLRADIKQSKVTTRDLLLTVAFPIAVLIVGALIVALVVGHGKIM